MAAEMKNIREEPTKPWKEYLDDDLHSYLVRNMNKEDCSFIVSDPENKKPLKELKSFKWILYGMSPVFKKILNNETNKANNFKLIPISDPHFEGVIEFGHTKRVNEPYDDLLDLYKSALDYEIDDLRDLLLVKIRNMTVFGTLDWLKFFRISSMAKKPMYFAYVYHLSMLYYFRNICNMERDLRLKSNLEIILDFNLDTFDDFACFISCHIRSQYLCFKIIERYLIKHAFDGKTPQPPEQQGYVARSLVKKLLYHIKFYRMSLEEFKKGPEKSNLLDEPMKKRILETLGKKKSPKLGCL